MEVNRLDRLRAGGNSPTWLKPVALLPLIGRFVPWKNYGNIFLK
jgi:hypothetical protein